VLIVNSFLGQPQRFPGNAALASLFGRRYIRLVQRAAIQIVNGLWLALVLAGVPVATSIHVGHLTLSSLPALRAVTLWTLGVAAVGNLAAGLFVVKTAKLKSLCWMWALAFALLFSVEYLTFSGQLRFDWLKRFLGWLQHKL